MHLAIAYAQKAPRKDHIENVILDLPPHSSAQVAWLLSEADLIVVPTRPTATDLVTLQQTIDLVHATKRPAGFVLNAFKPHLVEARELPPILAKYHLPIVGSPGRPYCVLARAPLPAGLGGHEMGDEGAEQERSKARAEL